MKCAQRARIGLTTPLRDAEPRLMGSPAQSGCQGAILSALTTLDPRAENVSDPVASALLLIIVAIAYLVGAFVVITALAKVLSAWSASWSTRGNAGDRQSVVEGKGVSVRVASGGH